MSESVFKGYLKSHPESLAKLFTVLTNDHYNIIQDQDTSELKNLEPVVITEEKISIFEIECKVNKKCNNNL